MGGTGLFLSRVPKHGGGRLKCCSCYSEVPFIICREGTLGSFPLEEESQNSRRVRGVLWQRPCQMICAQNRRGKGWRKHMEAHALPLLSHTYQ